MTKNKLKRSDIIAICNRYVSDDRISLEEIAKDYNCSASHISKYIHKSIVFRCYRLEYG